MKKKDFENLLASIKEAGAIKAGRKAASRVYQIKQLELRAARKKAKVKQMVFARMVGTKTSTLRNWEQGRRRPRNPPKAL